MPNNAGTKPLARRKCERGALETYDRRVELPRALPLWPHEIEDASLDGRQRMVARLARALRAERRRGVAGHWTYDLARHVALLRVYRLELAAFRQLQRQSQFRSAMLKISAGGTTSPNAMRTATATTMSARSARSCSALKRSE